jgi:hypothetical protein
MSEIWRASKNPGRWQQEATDKRMLWWWLTWLACAIAGSIHVDGSRPGYRALMLREQLDAVFSLLGVVSTILAFLAVRQVGIFQAEAADRSLSAVFA